MKTCAILNPQSGSAGQQNGLRPLLDDLGIDWWATEGPGDAVTLAQDAVAQDFDVVVAVGGDGTIHEVVNGLMTGEGGARLGVVPLGTGNDLARTLALPDDPRDALAWIWEGPVRTLDLFTVDSSDVSSSYVVNAAAGGFSGQVDEQLTSEMKETWGPLAFLFGAVNALPELQDYETRIAYDDEPEEVVPAFNVIVANGRMVGGGKAVAPTANPEDGLLDVVTIRTGTVLEMTGVTAMLVAGNYLEHDLVTHRRVRRVRIASEPGMWFNVDGELLTKEPITFEVRPVIVGPEYTATPEV